MAVTSSVPDELATKLKAGQCVLFLGAGFSRSLGLPTWDELTEAIARRISKQKRFRQERLGAAKLDSLQLAQYFVDVHGGSRQPLNATLDEWFRAADKPYDDQHTLLARLPISTLVTTNWDSALELALRAAGLSANVIYKDSQVSSWSEGEARQVIKMHGTIEDKDSLVVAHEDYLRYSRTHGAMEHLLRTLFATRTVLIIGFSLRDQNFGRIFHELRQLLADSRRPAYAVFANEPEVLLDYWAKRGLSIIGLRTSRAGDVSKRLVQFVEELVELCGTIALTKSERTRLCLREYIGSLDCAGPQFCMRVRASLGPFGSPRPTSAFRVFSQEDDDSAAAFDVDSNEWRINRACSECLAKGAMMRCVVSIDPCRLTGKYSPRQAIRRVDSLMSAYRKYTNLLLANKEGDLEQNIVILGERCMIESLKPGYGDKLYAHAELVTNVEEIRARAKRFDREFEAAWQQNVSKAAAMGLAGESDAAVQRGYILRLLEESKRHLEQS